MTALRIIEKAANMIGCSGVDDSRIQAIAINALNRIYAELFFLDNGENFREITELTQPLYLGERLYFDVLPYGVASLIAAGLGDSENSNYYGQIYNLKRKKHVNSVMEDVIPTV